MQLGLSKGAAVARCRGWVRRTTSPVVWPEHRGADRDRDFGLAHLRADILIVPL